MIQHSSYRLLILIAACNMMICCRKEKAGTASAVTWTDADSAQIIGLVSRGFSMQEDKPDSAMIYLRKAEQLSRESGFEDGIGYALQNMGAAAVIQGKYDEGFAYYEQAMPYCIRATRIKNVLVFLYINMANSYFYKGDYARSSQYDYKALRHLMKTHPDDHNIATIYTNMSATQYRLGQYHMSLHYAEKAENILRQRNLPIFLIGALNNKGDAYAALGRPDAAYATNQEALALAREAHSLRSQQSILLSLSKLMLQQGRNREAIVYIREAMQLPTGSNRFYSYILPRYQLGQAYYQLKDYQLAAQTLLEGLAEAKRTGLIESSMDAHAALASIYKETGRYKEALAHHEKYMQLKDTSMNQEKINAINELEIKYNSIQKDKELSEKKLLISQQKNHLNNKNIWIVSTSLGSLVLGILLISRNRISKQKQQGLARQIQILQQAQEMQQQVQEINRLKNIMQGEEKERVRIARDLHDGVVSHLLAIRLHFNGTLQNKEGQTLRSEDFRTTLEYLDNATRELRKTAHNLMPETVLQGGLVVALHSYCSTMSEASGLRIEFQHIGIRARMDPEIELSLYRIVQELIQNVLKHAQATHVLVQLNVQDPLLSITVEDNGTGCSPATLAKTEGIGLKGIDTRVKSLQGIIEFSSTEDVGTTVYLEFNFPADPLFTADTEQTINAVPNAD